MLYGCGHMFGGEHQIVRINILPPSIITSSDSASERLIFSVKRRSHSFEISYTLNQQTRNYNYKPLVHLLFGCNLAPLVFTSSLQGYKKCFPVFAALGLLGIDIRTKGWHRYDSVLHIQDDGKKVRIRSEY